MSPHFYVEDTCALKSDPTQIGQIDRTFSDVSTHRADPLRTYYQGIDRGQGVSKAAFRDFSLSGIPSRGSVLVTWNLLAWHSDLKRKSILISETELELVDRNLLTGDVVKRSPQDAISGTVIRTSTLVNLIQPARWPQASSQPNSSFNFFGNYAADRVNILQGVSTDDLVSANRYEPGHFVLYKDWVGKVLDTWEDVHLRLSNNSIVVVDDPDELEPLYGELHDSEGLLSVGDAVKTKKANLRRGRWIYGAFNANVEPMGYICDVRTTSLEVDWLSIKYSPSRVSAPQPPVEIVQDILDSGEVHIYDRRTVPPSSKPLPPKRNDLDVFVAKKVRFRDIAGAAVKYNQGEMSVTRIPRSDASGYDINVFCVAQTKTTCTVQWQDLSMSELPAKVLTPYLDVGGEDEVWPGELIATRKSTSDVVDLYLPEKMGVVQSVDALDCMARVKWFKNAKLVFAQEPESEQFLLPESFTGKISDMEEQVSLYDIWSLPGLSRRIGDYVALSPIDQEMVESLTDITLYEAALAAVAAPIENRDWFGEIIELGLDGLLTVRLGASANVRDIKVPWESTIMIYSSDMDESDDEDIDMEMEESMSEDSDVSYSSAVEEIIEIRDGQGVWRSVEADEDMDDWTDEEDVGGDEDMDQEIGMNQEQKQKMPETAVNGHTSLGPKDQDDMTIGTLPDNDTTRTPVYALSGSQFSYSSMFEGERPHSFVILDGEAPPEHRFYDNVHEPMTNAQLRRIQKEHKILKSSLPDGVYVRTWEASLHLVRVLILGPLDTPYEYAPFIIDLALDSNFPNQPPTAFFHSWTNGTGPINPNLYEDGKICLSLLGTWHGDAQNETWSAQNSTILQLLVSLLGLVLVKDPFYNEAGYESRAGTEEARIPAAMYSERTFFKSRAFITHALMQQIHGFERELQLLYQDREGPQLLKRALMEALDVIKWSKSGKAKIGVDNPRRISAGALVPLRRQVEVLMALLRETDGEGSRKAEIAVKELS